MSDAVHVVRDGDTLSAISARYYGKGSLYRQLATYNKLKNPNLIRPGDIIKIPPRLWGIASPSSGEDNAVIVTIKRATQKKFELGTPIVIGSYQAARSILIERTGKRLRISGSMEAYGNGASAATAAMAEASIRKEWSRTLPDGFGTVCEVTIGCRAPGVSPSPVAQIEMNLDSGVAHVNRWTKTMVLYLKDESGRPSLEDCGWTAAHEFGHVLGLGDRYSEGFISKIMAIIGKDSQRSSTIQKGYEKNLMARMNGQLETKNIEDLDIENSPSLCEDDDRIRLWVSGHALAQIAELNAATKIRMIEILLGGVVSSDDLDTIEAICRSVTDREEGTAVGQAFAKHLLAMTDLGQRTRARGIISKLP